MHHVFPFEYGLCIHPWVVVVIRVGAWGSLGPELRNSEIRRQMQFDFATFVVVVATFL